MFLFSIRPFRNRRLFYYLATGKGYLLTDTAYDFDFKYMGQEAPYIPIHVNDGKTIMNKLMCGNLEITKTSEDKKIESIWYNGNRYFH